MLSINTQGWLPGTNLRAGNEWLRNMLELHPYIWISHLCKCAFCSCSLLFLFFCLFPLFKHLTPLIITSLFPPSPHSSALPLPVWHLVSAAPQTGGRRRAHLAESGTYLTEIFVKQQITWLRLLRRAAVAVWRIGNIPSASPPELKSLGEAMGRCEGGYIVKSCNGCTNTDTFCTDCKKY